VRRGSPVYQPLERFLTALGLPFLARLADSEVFLQAAESGVGIFEMDPLASTAEREQFMPIVEWADPDYKSRANKVIELSRPAWVSGRAL
jgi:chromosome partitioning protein